MDKVIAAALAAILAYIFGNFKAKKDADLEKKRALNVVLANFLDVWYYVSRFELARKVIANNKDSIIPLNVIPQVIIKTDIVNKDAFDNLDKSIDELKPYDPFVYFSIQDTGRVNDFFTQQIVEPFMSGDISKPEIQISLQATLAQMLGEIEENTIFVCKQISFFLKFKVKRKFNKLKKDGLDNIVDGMEKQYFEMMKHVLQSLGLGEITFEEFREFAKSKEHKDMMSKSVGVLLTGDPNNLMANLNNLMADLQKTQEINTNKVEG